MSRIRQLALDWQARASQDLADAKKGALRDVKTAYGLTRRNCAWELIKVLDALDKENPAEAGSLAPTDADRESA